MTVRSLPFDRRGSSAAEFALVLPLLILLLFGIIDTGRFFWELNRSEKATQMGARMAIVTDPVSPDLVGASYVSGTIKAGDVIPANQLGTVKCTSTGCTCETAPCPSGGGTVDSAAFNLIVARMAKMNPLIAANNVVIRYSGSGFGYAGAADETMDVQPLVNVQLQNMQFRPIALLGFGGWNLPNASATLTAEDSSGSISN
ncbi:TadE/TadG family type IV pilus assembly protein [Sphingomonas jaspsi]|uniref:TadE/TadG family type IV pilus assembly protein n=1 Tax=Sphingomonas jaspsi TaxID=392409 RepID=UPI0004B38FD2|nr:TadE/TadG family type IV pilus assembly protein [Sphingomonas jaspsi]